MINNLKKLAKTLSANPIFRPLISVGYCLIIYVEFAVERLLDMFHPKPCGNHKYDNVTAVIKTFERPDKLRRLLKSIKRTFPELKIIVVDDSRQPVETGSEHIEVITLPFDSGVSAGRAAGLAKVTTPYVINLDDDFIFNRKTRLIRALSYLQRNQNIDLVAGEVAYLPYYIRFDYTGHKLMDYSKPPLYEKGTDIDGLKVFEKCANFFIARTDKLKEVGWDSEIKRLDHADFYTRIRGKLTTVFDPDIELLHDPTHFNPYYLKIRHDYSQDSIVLNNRYSGKQIQSEPVKHVK